MVECRGSVVWSTPAPFGHSVSFRPCELLTVIFTVVPTINTIGYLRQLQIWVYKEQPITLPIASRTYRLGYYYDERGQCGFISPLVRTTTATVLHWGIYRLACGGYDLDPYTY